MAANVSETVWRAFIDSSAPMAASLSETGSARAVFDAASDGRMLLFASPFVFEETERNIFRKASYGIYAFRELCARPTGGMVDPTRELQDQVALNVEPKAAPIVAAAIVARADFLITYDRRHLLRHAELIEQRYGIVTTTPDVAPTYLGD